MTNREKIKMFTRFLKELGLYNEWLKQRKDWIKILKPRSKTSRKNIFECVNENFYLALIINDSFSWGRTNNREMWRELYSEAYEYNVTTQTDVTEYAHFIKRAKEIVKKHTG